MPSYQEMEPGGKELWHEYGGDQVLPTLQVFFIDGFWLLVSTLHIAVLFVFVLYFNLC